MYRLIHKLPKGCWVGDLSRKYPNLEIKIYSLINFDGFCTARAFIKDLGLEHIRYIKNHENVYNIKTYKDSDYISTIKVLCNCPLTEDFIKSGAIPTTPVNVSCGYAQWDAPLEDDIDIIELMSKLRRRGLTAMIRKAKDSELTKRQREVLIKAISEGYYDYPRRITLTQLANKLNMSKGALSEILRRIESKIIKSYIY